MASRRFGRGWSTMVGIIRYLRVFCRHGMDSAAWVWGPLSPGPMSTAAVLNSRFRRVPCPDRLRRTRVRAWPAPAGRLAPDQRRTLTRPAKAVGGHASSETTKSKPTPQAGAGPTAALNGGERLDPQRGLPAGHAPPSMPPLANVPATRQEERGRRSLNRTAGAGRRCRSGARAFAARMNTAIGQLSNIGCCPMVATSLLMRTA